MSDTAETFWLVMRVRRWENITANGMDIAAAPELGTGYVCAFDTEAAAVAACQDGDTVAAVRGKATPWQMAGRMAEWSPSDAELAGAMEAIEANPESGKEFKDRLFHSVIDDIDGIYPEPPAAPLVKVPLGSQETWEEFRAAACTATQAELQAWGSRPGGLSEAWRKSRAEAAAEKGEE